MRHAHPMEEMVDAAIAVLAEELADGRDVEQVELALEQAGDALRIGIALPLSLARWMRALSLEVLGEVVSRWVERLSSASLPGSGVEHEVLGEVVSLRDRSESVALGIRRACVGADRVPGELLEPLLAAQRGIDTRLDVPRATVELALGIRRALFTSDGWIDALREDDEGDWGEPLALEGSVPADVAPSDEAVTAFIAHGEHAAVVLAFAARSPELAESIREAIAVFRSVGEPVSLVARRWAKQSEAQGEGMRAEGAVVRIGVREAMAAADEELPDIELDLGVLAPTEAEAWLRVKEGQMTLRVLAEPGSLSSVSFGEERVEHESEPGVWSLACAWRPVPMRLEVQSVDGRTFDVMVELSSESDAP